MALLVGQILPQTTRHTSEGKRRRLRLGRCGWVDHAADFGDFVGREAAEAGVLADDRFVFGEVDAKGLVAGDVALDPLDVGTELLEGRVYFCAASLNAWRSVPPIAGNSRSMMYLRAYYFLPVWLPADVVEPAARPAGRARPRARRESAGPFPCSCLRCGSAESGRRAAANAGRPRYRDRPCRV